MEKGSAEYGVRSPVSDWLIVVLRYFRKESTPPLFASKIVLRGFLLQERIDCAVICRQECTPRCCAHTLRIFHFRKESTPPLVASRNVSRGLMPRRPQTHQSSDLLRRGRRFRERSLCSIAMSRFASRGLAWTELLYIGGLLLGESVHVQECQSLEICEVC